MSQSRTLVEKRDHIMATLKWFNVIPTEKFTQKLTKAKSISISDYLDEALIPLISKLHKNKQEGMFWGNQEDIQFRGLISLCFSGDLSQKAWDEVWKYLKEDEQLFYTTTDYYLGEPLAIAARYGNLAALKRLEATYQQLLSKYPDRRRHMLLQLRRALVETPKHIKTQQHINGYDFLLGMCEKYATLLDPNASSVGFSNKKFEYRINGLYAGDGETPLLDVFADICSEYFHEKNLWAINKLTHYVRTKGIGEDFSQFKSKLLVLLADKYTDEKYQECWKALESQEEYLLNLRSDEVEEKVDVEVSQSKQKKSKEKAVKNDKLTKLDTPNEQPSLSSNGEKKVSQTEETHEHHTSSNKKVNATETNVSKDDSHAIRQNEDKQSQKKQNGNEQEHQQLYLRAYKAQEFQHAWRRYLGRVGAIIAAFIPPISLVFTIYCLINDEHHKAKPLWRKITEGVLFAVLPIASGAFSWLVINDAEVRRRKEDAIQKVSTSADQFEESKRTIAKNSMTHIDWEALKKEQENIKKPKKIIVNQDVYMDRAQKLRRESLLAGTSSCTTEFFKQSYKQSAEIGDKIQKKYGRRS